jgi:GPH family glycoside/pentoside/hexuronide:cation symporter
MSKSRLSVLQLAAYASPGAALSLAVVPITAVLPTLYAKYAAVSLTAVGVVFMLRTIFDALSDQIIGYLSDITRTRIGARKPWLIGGSALVALSVYFLFRIPSDAGITYFGFWTVVFYVGYTMMEIPRFAWGNEMSGDYQERARIFGYKGLFDAVGNFTFSLVPIVLTFFGTIESEEYTPELLFLLGIIIIVALPLLTTLAVTLAPHGENRDTPRTSISGLFHSVAGNKPFLRFLLAYMVAGAGTGFFAALIFPYTSEYLGIGSSFPLILFVTTICSMTFIPIWVRLVYRFGKHRCWGVGWILNSLVLLPLALVEPGPAAVLPVTICMALYGITGAVSVVAPFSILSDIVDYDILRTGVDRAGNYFAMVMLVVKMLASTGGIALVLLGVLFGYDMADGAVNTDFANAGLVWMFILAPAVFQIAAVPLIWNFPIDARRQGIIRRRIEQRTERRKTVKPAPESAG